MANYLNPGLAARSSFSSVEEVVPPLVQQWWLNDDTGTWDDGVSSVNAMTVPDPWQTIAGDWNGDGTDDVGLYDPSTGTFHLYDKDGNPADPSEYVAPGADPTWLPLVGNWDGRGNDNLGLYDPATQAFHFYNQTTDGGLMPESFSVPGVAPTWTPLAGDWDGDGVDTIGAYNPSRRVFFFNNELDGTTDTVTRFAAGRYPRTWIPIVGDWDGNDTDTAGVYAPGKRMFYLNNKNRGRADVRLTAPRVPTTYQPLTGDWDGDGDDTTGLYAPDYVPNNYVMPPGIAASPARPTWSYVAVARSSFFATIISGAQRLPNGNTLIDEGTEGRFFEVTPEGDIVWQYKNPVVPGNQGLGRPLTQGETVPKANFGIPGVWQNLVFRAHKYAPDYAGLGDMVPDDRAPIEL